MTTGFTVLIIFSWLASGYFAWAWMNYSLNEEFPNFWRRDNKSDAKAAFWASIFLGFFAVPVIFFIMREARIKPYFGFRFML